MKSQIISQLSEEEIELAKEIQEVGVSRATAVTLVYLGICYGIPKQSREIERASRLRQPEVSRALRSLLELDLITVEKLEDQRQKTYTLKKPLPETLANLIHEKQGKYEQILIHINELIS